ncbi:hypothetical protein MA16_Dca013350 [Dendrobium catenatum]|uniref:Uncharacterized protein n=1 Tax=Dendrobium catenatum TaxID=906689 RepID=A0A2I0VIR2_9ASPA|nr:hypothetical protein MA16_Dca013350 [Dendrobium catenatum]
MATPFPYRFQEDSRTGVFCANEEFGACRDFRISSLAFFPPLWFPRQQLKAHGFQQRAAKRMPNGIINSTVSSKFQFNCMSKLPLTGHLSVGSRRLCARYSDVYILDDLDDDVDFSVRFVFHKLLFLTIVVIVSTAFLSSCLACRACSFVAVRSCSDHPSGGSSRDRSASIC